MPNSRNQQKKRKIRALSRAVEKWNELKRLSDEERKQVLNRRARYASGRRLTAESPRNPE